jgi:AcrR family transcriptional regulator
VVERGAARGRAILRAVIDLIGEVGYEALTMDAVAARAGASKATIYRRWQGKADMVRAALDAYDAERNAAAPDTGTLRGDLVGILEMLRATVTPAYVALTGGLARAMRTDPELAAVLRAHMEDEELSPFAGAVDRAVARGELAPDVDATLLHDVAESLLAHRITLQRPMDDAFVARVVDEVLLPVLARWRDPR